MVFFPFLFLGSCNFLDLKNYGYLIMIYESYLHYWLKLAFMVSI